MCGRFVSSSPPDELAEYFDAEAVTGETYEPSYNVAPSGKVFVVVETGGIRRLDRYHWGLIPFWAKDAKTGLKMINARAERLAASGAFKRAFAKRRCIVPADGFYEWRKLPGSRSKQPMYIHRSDGEPVALAGLWELWRPPQAGDAEEDSWFRSCTIITGEPNEKLAPIHDRMPVILPPSEWETWLDPANDDLEALGKLLVPAPARLLEVHPVGTAVNNVRENGPELIEPVEEIGPADRLEAEGGQATLV